MTAVVLATAMPNLGLTGVPGSAEHTDVADRPAAVGTNGNRAGEVFDVAVAAVSTMPDLRRATRTRTTLDEDATRLGTNPDIAGRWIGRRVSEVTEHCVFVGRVAANKSHPMPESIRLAGLAADAEIEITTIVCRIDRYFAGSAGEFTRSDREAVRVAPLEAVNPDLREINEPCRNTPEVIDPLIVQICPRDTSGAGGCIHDARTGETGTGDEVDRTRARPLNSTIHVNIAGREEGDTVSEGKRVRV